MYADGGTKYGDDKANNECGLKSCLLCFLGFTLKLSFMLKPHLLQLGVPVYGKHAGDDEGDNHSESNPGRAELHTKVLRPMPLQRRCRVCKRRCRAEAPRCRRMQSGGMHDP